MNTTSAQNSIRKVAATATSLEPSALIVLFEIDISALIARSERVVNHDAGQDHSTRLRFHNNLKLIQSLRQSKLMGLKLQPKDRLLRQNSPSP